MINQIKIGKFIAQMRKEKELTQRQLAEQVGVSDKTVSKWETGRSMPDNSVIMDVCMVLEINVNELLLGERISEENYVDKAEENMIELVKESERQRKKGNWSVVGTILGLLMLGFASVGTIFMSGGVQAIGYFIDRPSLLLVVGTTFLVLAVSGLLHDFWQGFCIVCDRKVYNQNEIKDSWMAMKMTLLVIPLAGIFAFVVGLVSLMATLEGLDYLGANLAVAMLTIFYSALLDIFLIPITVRLRKKLFTESSNE